MKNVTYGITEEKYTLEEAQAALDAFLKREVEV